MSRTTRVLLIALSMLGMGRAFGQELAPSPTPVGRVPVASGCARPWCLPAPPACADWEDHNGDLLHYDPLLEDLCGAPPGWYGALEASFVRAHVKNRLYANVGPDLVHLPTAELDWTVSPEFTLGYRFGQASGEVLVSYRLLITDGAGTIDNFDAAGNAAALQSRLNLHLVDVAYASREFGLAPLFEMKWFVGLRFGTAYFDSIATSPGLDQITTNNYWGIGPRVGLNLARTFQNGIDVFCRPDASFLYGQVHQSFGETVTAATGTQTGGAFTQSHTMFVPIFNVEAGVGWTPPVSQRLHFAAGYQFQRWFNVGEVQLAVPGPFSRAEITFQGVFIRAEWSY
jgi:hypothetical protein